MPHPKIQKFMYGKMYHLEDTVTTKGAAEALRTHLVKTEDKIARVKHTKDGYEVWWTK